MMQTYMSGSSTYIDVASFDVATSGRYVVVIKGTGATVVLGPSITSLIALLPWIILIVFGALASLAGLVILIIGIARRSSSHRVLEIPGYKAPGYVTPGYAAPSQAAPVYTAPALPLAGWYPDPSNPEGRRYWDGAGWTEYRA